jgi:hypothetical protein
MLPDSPTAQMHLVWAPRGFAPVGRGLIADLASRGADLRRNVNAITDRLAGSLLAAPDAGRGRIDTTRTSAGWSGRSLDEACECRPGCDSS